MIRILLLALLFLVSCGGDDNGTSTASVTGFHATSSYITGATFFYDANDNGVYDKGELQSSSTDQNGYGTFSPAVPEGGKIIQLTGGMDNGFNYMGKLKGVSKGSQSIILSPLTTLTANGFTKGQVVNLFNSVEVPITEDLIDQNPNGNPTLLVASLCLSQALLASPKGFDLEPADTVVMSERSTEFSTPYAQKLFKQSAVVYKELINQDSFEKDPKNLSKTSASFFTFINRFGADAFVNDLGEPKPEIENAKLAIQDVVDQSLNSNEPVALELNSGVFTADVLKNQPFQPGSYDLIGVDQIDIYTRQVDNTISNYAFSPNKVRFNFLGANITKSDQMTVKNDTIERSWVLDPATNFVNFKQSISQENGQKPSNVQVVDRLPISTYNENTSMILRVSEFEEGTLKTNGNNIRLIGEGDSIFNYMGIDWGADPTDPNAWVINNSRTNNCIVDATPTVDCAPGVGYYFNEQSENANIKSFASLGRATDPGAPVPQSILKFTLSNNNLGTNTSQAPLEITISKFEMVPARLVSVECISPKGCIAVKADEEDPRPPLEDTTDVSFLIGYRTFPTDYKVHAINKVFFKLGEYEDVACTTTNSSSFFKDNILFLKLTCPVNFPNAEYLFIDLASRLGVLASYERIWKDGALVKFKYRDFNRITLKDVLP
jgi:hypothetical protein